MKKYIKNQNKSKEGDKKRGRKARHQRPAYH
jgi:hypothetical protein